MGMISTEIRSQRVGRRTGGREIVDDAVTGWEGEFAVSFGAS